MVGNAVLLGAVGFLACGEVISNEKYVPEEKQAIQTATTTNTNDCVICMEEITHILCFLVSICFTYRMLNDTASLGLKIWYLEENATYLCRIREWKHCIVSHSADGSTYENMTHIDLDPFGKIDGLAIGANSRFILMNLLLLDIEQTFAKELNYPQWICQIINYR